MDCNDGNVKGFVGYKYPTYACCFLWKYRVGIYAYAGAGCLTKRTRAYVRTAHTLHVGFKVFVLYAGKVCGATMHAVGGDAGSCLLRLLSKTQRFGDFGSFVGS